jgi:hypothetical protein
MKKKKPSVWLEKSAYWGLRKAWFLKRFASIKKSQAICTGTIEKMP